MTNDIMTIDPGTAVEQYYGSRELVAEFANRLVPLYAGIEAKTVQLVAQLAISHGANPLPMAGEIWVWESWDARTSSKRLTVDLGVQYYRRVVADNLDAVIWVRPPDIMDDGRKQLHGLSNKDLAAECIGYLKSEYAALRFEGFSMVEAEKRLARRGIGVVKYGEMFAENDLSKNGRVWKKAGSPFDPPKGRTWLWVAEKRAEKDLLKKKASVASPLTERIRLYNQRHLDYLEAQTRQPAVGKVDIDQLNNELYGDQSDTGPAWTEFDEPEAVIIDAVVDGDFVPVIPGGFNEGDEVMVAGKNDERLGLVVGADGDFVKVVVDGEEMRLNPERLSIVDAAVQDELPL